MKLLKTALLLTCFLYSFLAIAQKPFVLKNGKSVFLGKNTAVFEDKQNLTIQQIQDKKFVEYVGNVYKFPINEHHYWIRFEIDYQDQEAYILEIDKVFLQKINLYYQDSSKNWQKLANGSAVRWQDRSIEHFNPTFLLPQKSGVFYLQYANNANSLPIKIYPKEEFEQYYYFKNIAFGVLIGILLFVVFNNLYYATQVRSANHFWYALLTFFYLLFALFFEGYLFAFFKDFEWIGFHLSSMGTISLFGITCSLIVIYAANFFDLDKKSAWFKARNLVIIYFLLHQLTYFKNSLISASAQFGAMFALFYALSLGVWAVRKKLVGSSFFLLAYILYFAFSVLEVMTLNGVISKIFFFSYGTIGCLAEIFVLAYSLNQKNAAQTKALQKAKDDAQQEVVRLVKEQNTELENQVKIRTIDLQEAYEEINQTNSELNQTLLQLEAQNQLIASKNENITSSINYARRIQAALLPSEEKIKAYIPDFFALYAPKDIVSGDFFWFTVQDKYCFLACGDCTGHGVPGAFMTLIGNTLLNQIVNEKKMFSPALILQELNQRLFIMLRQQNAKINDGMDLAFVRLDLLAKELVFASAKRPLIYFSSNQLVELKGNKHAIGGEEMRKEFVEHSISYKNGDVFYLFTDGVVDQFNEKGEKIMIKRFRKYLEEAQSMDFEAQRRFFQRAFLQWKGKSEQIDDVLLLGIKP